MKRPNPVNLEGCTGSLNDIAIFKAITKRQRLKNGVSMWSTKHEPKNADDLVIHPKKVEEVKAWLRDAFKSSVENPNLCQENKGNIILLTGPPGCGKTATIKALSHDLKFSIQEWTNPTSSVEYKRTNDDYVIFERDTQEFLPKEDTIQYESQIKGFSRFMTRANRYGILPGLDHEKSISFSIGNSNTNKVLKRKIVLIEELPTFVYRDTNEFHSILKRYTNNYNTRDGFPLVIIQSENKSSKVGSKDDHLRKLFPPEFLSENNIRHIQFNSVSPTNMIKGLTSIAMIESSYGERSFRIPDKASLSALAASVNGDIRAAINALQFACLNNYCTDSDFKQCFDSYTTLASSSTSHSKKALNSKKKNSNVSNPAKGNKKENQLATIGGKDPTIDLFHAIGKVLYCKREEDEEGAKSLAEDMNLLPHKLQKISGPLSYARRALKVNPEELLEHIPISTPDAFTAFLHQSYLDFFGGDTGIHDVANAAESLSLADPFFNEWVSTGKIALTDYGGSIAVRGLCHSNTRTTKMAGMYTFNKPEWYNTIAKYKSTFQMLSSRFRERNLSNEELATNFVPILTQCFASEMSSDILDANAFYPRKDNSKASSNNVKTGSQPMIGHKDAEQCGSEEEKLTEDFIIEDFDD